MSKTINISLPEDLVTVIDEESKKQYSSRSDYIRETLVHRVQGKRLIDDWGDEGNWSVVVDFTDINPRGVDIEEVLRAGKKIFNG